MVEKDRRVIGEDDLGIHLGRALERCLRDMVVRRELNISLYQRLASMMMMSFGKDIDNIFLNINSGARRRDCRDDFMLETSITHLYLFPSAITFSHGLSCWGKEVQGVSKSKQSLLLFKNTDNLSPVHYAL